MALADASSCYWKELQLLMEFHNITPPWEKDVAAGGDYVWAVTSFAWGLHTADPGETGKISDNPPVYAAYAFATSNRGVGFFTLTGSGTMNPQMSPSVAINWPTNGTGAEAVTTVTVAMVYLGAYYSMMRDIAVTGSPVTIGLNEKPNCAVGAIFIKRR